MIWVSEWSRWLWESWTFRQNTLWHVSCNHRRLCDVYFLLFVSWWCKRANDTKRNIRKPDSSWLALICQRQPWHFVCNRSVDFEWALRSFRASTRFYSRKISIIDEWVGNRKQFLFSTMCELFIAASRLCICCVATSHLVLIHWPKNWLHTWSTSGILTNFFCSVRWN